MIGIWMACASQTWHLMVYDMIRGVLDRDARAVDDLGWVHGCWRSGRSRLSVQAAPGCDGPSGAVVAGRSACASERRAYGYTYRACVARPGPGIVTCVRPRRPWSGSGGPDGPGTARARLASFLASLSLCRHRATSSGGSQPLQVFQFRSTIVSRSDRCTCSNSVKPSSMHVEPAAPRRPCTSDGTSRTWDCPRERVSSLTPS